jgi:hypothetical protein
VLSVLDQMQAEHERIDPALATVDDTFTRGGDELAATVAELDELAAGPDGAGPRVVVQPHPARNSSPIPHTGSAKRPSSNGPTPAPSHSHPGLAARAPPAHLATN